MQAFYVEITREDGSLERVRVEKPQITLGRAPHAGIPVPDARELEPEHLFIQPLGESCWVSVAQGARTQVMIGGVPFDNGMVQWGTVLEIAGLRLTLTDKGPTDRKKTKDSSGQQQASPVVMLGIPLILGVGGFLWWRSQQASISDPPPNETVTLFADQTPCGATGTQAIDRADNDERAADAKSERYPFEPSDGVQAVTLYQRAYDCYRIANFTAEAEHMRAEGERLKRRIEEDYRSHQFRYGRATVQNRPVDRLREVEATLALLKQIRQEPRYRNHPYIAWLDRTKRQVELEVQAQNPQQAK